MCLSLREKCQFVELMMFLITHLGTALSYTAVRAFPSCWAGKHPCRKQACQEDQGAPCCLGLRVILEIKVIIRTEDTFFFNSERILQLGIFWRTGHTSQMLLQYLPDVRKLWDGQLWFREEILCHGTCWESIPYWLLEINSPVVYIWLALLHQKQLVTVCSAGSRINCILM